jgi:hypothetical protein
MNIAGYYSIYLVISLAVTIWVAQTLHRRGRPFLVEVFHGNQQLADATSHLLIVGFYLVNIGHLGIAFDQSAPFNDLRQIFGYEFTKVGSVLLILGLMHSFHVLILTMLRRRSVAEATMQA